MSSESVEVGGLSITVRRSGRRRTFELTVERDGRLRVYVPAGTSEQELTLWIRKKLLWVYRKLAQRDARVPQRPPREFVTGESYSFLGRSCRLRLVEGQDAPIQFDGETFFLRRDARLNASQHFRRWYRLNGSPWMRERVSVLAARVGTIPRRVQVRELGFRWGSCGRDGIVSLHWKLVQLPPRLIDYVIIHELVHLVEPHHGRGFRSRLERALPDWHEREEDLAQRAAAYLAL